MKKSHFTIQRYVLPFSITAALSLSGAFVAHAATWQWIPMQDRERVLITFDSPIQNVNLARNEGLRVEIQAPMGNSPLIQQGASPSGDFVHAINLSENGENGIELTFNKSDFGYIYTQPSANSIIVEIYEDPLATRFFPYEERVENVPMNEQSIGEAVETTESAELAVLEPLDSAEQTVLTAEDFGIEEPEPAQESAQEEIIQENPIQTVQGFDSGETEITQAPQESIVTDESNPQEDVAEQENLVEEPTLPERSIFAEPEALIEENQAQANNEQNLTEENADAFQGSTMEEIRAAGENIYYGNTFTATLRDTPANSLESVAQPNYAFELDQPNPYEVFAELQDVSGEPRPSQSFTSPRNTVSIPGALFEGGANVPNQNTQSAQTPSESETLDEAIADLETEVLEPEIVAPEIVESEENEATEEALAELEEESLSDDEEMAEVAEVESEFVFRPEMTIDELPEVIPEHVTLIYHDAEGNEIPPPPNIPALLAQAEQLYEDASYADFIPIAEQLKGYNLDDDPDKQREILENLLYQYMDALYQVALVAGFNETGQKIVDAATEAMNFNLLSPRVPEALNVLARAHLEMGNLQEAEGYTQLLRRQYPYENSIPLLLYLLGLAYNNEAQYAMAATNLGYILSEYPDSQLAKDAAIAQITAYYRQGRFDSALSIIEFVNLRWPDAYLEEPEFLSMAADVQISEGEYEDALATLWQQFNVDPTNPVVPDTLNKIALLYYTTGDTEAAAKIELEILNVFPDSIYAPKALLRLAENTFMPPNPSLDELLELYSRPNPRIPSINYQIILDDYPQSPEAVDALTRLGALSFYNRDYSAALDYAQRVMETYPDRVQFNVASDILLRSFAHNMANALEEENYARALDLWETYPFVQNYYLPMENDLRVALARGYLNRGDSAEGLELLAPFITEQQNPIYGLYAYNLYLAHYLEQGDWNALLDLDEKVNLWNMPLDVRDQHDYTTALSAQNLGLTARAFPLWTQLAANTNIPLYQRAYATYFLARDAESKQDLRSTYQHNLDALAMFEQLQEERSEFSDPQRIRESIAALMDVTEVAGRFQESLDWLNRYSAFVPPESPDYAGLQLREARLYRKMNDLNTWQRILEQIIAREPESVFGQMAESELATQRLARDLSNITQ